MLQGVQGWAEKVSGKMTFEEGPQGGEGMSHGLSGVEGSRPAGRKGLESGACLVHLRSHKEASVTGAEGARRNFQGGGRVNGGSRER